MVLILLWAASRCVTACLHRRVNYGVPTREQDQGVFMQSLPCSEYSYYSRTFSAPGSSARHRQYRTTYRTWIPNSGNRNVAVQCSVRFVFAEASAAVYLRSLCTVRDWAGGMVRRVSRCPPKVGGAVSLICSL